MVGFTASRLGCGRYSQPVPILAGNTFMKAPTATGSGRARTLVRSSSASKRFQPSSGHFQIDRYRKRRVCSPPGYLVAMSIASSRDSLCAEVSSRFIAFLGVWMASIAKIIPSAWLRTTIGFDLANLPVRDLQSQRKQRRRSHVSAAKAMVATERPSTMVRFTPPFYRVMGGAPRRARISAAAAAGSRSAALRPLPSTRSGLAPFSRR
jgi:hypothetical protein